MFLPSASCFGNDGPAELSHAEELSERTRNAQPSQWRYGSQKAVADFGQAYVPINSSTQDQAAGRYRVEHGDTLQSVALALWGDAALWYMLAEANGLTAGSQLAAGMSLIVPNKVANFHHNADTFRPYDPNKAIGETSPTDAKPIDRTDKAGCGALGVMLVVVIAVAVAAVVGPKVVLAAQTAIAAVMGTTVTAGTAAAATAVSAGAVVGSAITGAAASIVSQGVGVATGLQDKFSWKGVALSALTAGLTQGVGGGQLIQGAGKFVNDAVRGALINAGTQGIAVATGLQNKFDWTGVAAAAAVSGVTNAISRGVGLDPNTRPANFTQYNQSLAASFAGAVAGAGTRTVLSGGSFGDNLMSVLPDVIGNTVGNAVAGEVIRAGENSAIEKALVTSGETAEDAQNIRQAQQALARGDMSDAAKYWALLNAGGSGSATINPVTDAEKSAYSKALAQTGDKDQAMGAVLATAIRQRVEAVAGRIATSQMSSAQKADFAKFHEAMNMALISNDVYFDRSIQEALPSGSRRLSDAQARRYGLTGSMLRNEATGYFAALYESKDGALVYANRGTDDGMFKLFSGRTPDGMSNSLQGAGESAPQYARAIENAQILTQNFKRDLTFTGHSLGGGLATAQALVTSRPAIVFNPAGLHEKTVAPYGSRVDQAYASKLVTAYVVNGEMLSRVNGHTLTLPPMSPLDPGTTITAPPARGNIVPLPAVELLTRREHGGSFQSRPNQSLSSGDLHTMLAILSSMVYRQDHRLQGGR